MTEANIIKISCITVCLEVSVGIEMVRPGTQKGKNQPGSGHTFLCSNLQDSKINELKEHYSTSY